GMDRRGQMSRSRRKLPPGPEDPPANQDDRSLPASLWDGCSVCYWTDAAFVIARLQCLLCVVGFTNCVIFATLQNLFLTATVKDDFSSWMSRVYYKWGVPS